MTLTNFRELSRTMRDAERAESKQAWRNKLLKSDPQHRPPMAQLMAWALAQSPQALARNEAPGVTQAVSTLAMKLALVALAHHADDEAQTFVSAQTVGEALSPDSKPRSQRNAGNRAIAGLIARGLVVVVDDPGNAPRTLELLWPDRRQGATTTNASRTGDSSRDAGTTTNASGTVDSSGDSSRDSSGAGTTTGTTDDALTSANATEVMKWCNKELSVTSVSADAGLKPAHQSDKVRQLREAADQRDDNARIEAQLAQLDADQQASRKASQQQAREADQRKQRDSEKRVIASLVAAEASTRHGIDYEQALAALLNSADFSAKCTPQLYRIVSNPEHRDRKRTIDLLAARVPGLIAEQVSA